jgi:hypothetical protein
MNMQLIQGQFTAREAQDLLTAMTEVKIRFHEKRITGESSEEEIKMRENRIKRLQNDLAAMCKGMNDSDNLVNIRSEFSVTVASEK